MEMVVMLRYLPYVFIHYINIYQLNNKCRERKFCECKQYKENSGKVNSIG